MKNRLLVILTAAALSVPIASPAALLTTVLSGVVIGADVYNVTFTQDDDGSTTFNQVFGTGDPVFTFTTAVDATAAALAVVNAAQAGVVDFDATPGGIGNIFFIPFQSDQTNVTDIATIYIPGLYQIDPAFTYSRVDLQYGSYATFKLASEASAPATLALLGIGLAVLGLSRRRKH